MNIVPTDDDPPILRLYRIGKSNPFTREDFLSFRELGIPLRHRTAKGLRLWDGISVDRERGQAAARARRTPGLGQFVAELHLPMDGRFRIELDDGDDGHCTIWGEPEALRALVVSVWPV